MNNDLFIATEYLKMAVVHRCTEEWINKYIRFMDSLTGPIREEILLNSQVTKLIDRINVGAV